MTTIDSQFQCNYLNSSTQRASDMLRSCVQDNNSPYVCENLSDRKDTTYTDNLSITRGFATYTIESPQTVDTPKLNDSLNDTFSFGNIEGFTNNIFITDNGPGKSSVPDGQCPEGFTKCPKSGKCIQICTNCIYRDNMKSQQFNEADPCFPQGTYAGVTNQGDIKCSCGSNNKYCEDDFVNDLFTTDGSIYSNKKIYNIGYQLPILNLYGIF